VPSLRLTPRTAALLVVVCTGVAYLNSLGGRFIMDDRCEIADNPAIRSLVPPWRAMLGGRNMPARPLPYLSFAVDRAIWGPEPFGYHVTNLCIHALAALALFAFARLALLSPRLRDSFGPHATELAACIAALWAVHPLGTQAVTYVYQRLESMTGMFCLAALAAFAQAAATGWRPRWLVASGLASAAAMGSKESAVVLPLLILGYDWLVLGEPAAAIWRRRRFYACLFAGWTIIAAHMLAQRGMFQELRAPIHAPLAYALTQPRVILHYLRLAFWPVGLCFDTPIQVSTTWGRIVPSLLYVVALLAAVGYGVLRRRPWAWLGVAFLLALAPTSSVMPVAALAAEHRMYLPLAAVVAAVVLGGYGVIARRIAAGPRRDRALRLAAGAVAVTVAVLAWLTQARNEVYATPGGIWLDVVRRQPGNARALWNLAVDCEQIGEFDAALRYADDVAGLVVAAPVYEDLAALRLQAGDGATAERILRQGIERRTSLAAADAQPAVAAWCNLAVVLRRQGKEAEAGEVAAVAFDRVLERLPRTDIRGLALRIIHADALHRAGDDARAEEVARSALADAGTGGAEDVFAAASAALSLATILHARGADAEAERIVRQALALVHGQIAAMHRRPPRVDAAGDFTIVLDASIAGLSPRPLEELLSAILDGSGRPAEADAIRRRWTSPPAGVAP